MSKKLTNKEIKTYIENNNYKLIDVYEESKIRKVKVECFNSHIYVTTWKNFRKGSRCSYCAKDKQRLDFDKVKYYIEIESNSGCKLISKKYINSDNPLEIKCKCGEHFFVSFSNFKRKKQMHCKRCNNFTDWNIEKVKQFCNTLDLILLEEQYINAKTKMNLKDNNGYLYFSNLNSLLSAKNINKFNKFNPYTIQNIKLWCKLNNKFFELVSAEYINNRQKLKWECLKEDCGEKFESAWSDIQSGNGCPFCAGKQVGLSNCLATKNPELAKEWHPTKNGDLTPYDITCSSGESVWWQCKDNIEHRWKAIISSRNKGNGCPYCSGRYPTKSYNLLVCNPGLCEEWDYKRNKSNPEDYTPNSGKKAWWKCKECDYKWKASIGNRNNGTSCPECNKSKGEIKIEQWLIDNNYIKIIQQDYDILNNLNEVNFNYFIPQKEFNNLLGVGNKNLSYDFYLPQYNLLVEYQGEQHEIYIHGFHKSKKDFQKQQEHDRRKKEYAQKHNIRLLEIWYYDFDNIEAILKRELNIQ